MSSLFECVILLMSKFLCVLPLTLFLPSFSLSLLHSAVLCGSWRHSAVLWSQWGWGMFGQCYSTAGQRSASGSGGGGVRECVRSFCASLRGYVCACVR